MLATHRSYSNYALDAWLAVPDNRVLNTAG
jgi:hypothetical protein